MSNRWFKDICVAGFTDAYTDVKIMMCHDSPFDIDQMQTSMRRMFLDQQSRNGTKGRIAGRGTAMTTKTSTDHDVYCFKCKERGHTKRNCPKFKPRTKPDGAAKWCSVHLTTSHSDEECYSQGATERLSCVRELRALLCGKQQVHHRHDSPRQGQRITRQREARHHVRRQQQRLRRRLHLHSSSHETIHPQHQGRNATGRQLCVGIIPRRRTDPRAEGKDTGVQGAFNAERDHNRRETHNLWSRHRHHLVHHPRQPRHPTPGQPPRAGCTRPRTQHLRHNSRAEERS